MAVATTVFALLLRLALAPVLGDSIPFILLYLSTTASATFGGRGPGLLATLLGALLAGIYLMPPVGVWQLDGIKDYVSLSLFIIVGSSISQLAGRLFELSRREQELRSLLQQTLLSIGDGVISTDSGGCIRIMNAVAQKLTGWPESEAAGRPMAEVFRIFREGTDEPASQPVDEVLRTGKTVGLANHTDLLMRDGRRLPIDDSGAPIRDEQNRVVGAVLVFRDISERRRAELALARSERRAHEIIRNMTDAFVVLDREWRIVLVNPAAERVLAQSAAQLIGRTHWEAFPSSVGTELEAQYRRAAAERIAVHFEHRSRNLDRWLEVNAYPTGDDLAIYFRDITERKQSEASLLRLHEDLRQFTYAASHDLREPLRMMTVYSQMLQRRLAGSLDEQSREFMATIVSGGMRASRLIDGLLEFSRMGETEDIEAGPVAGEVALTEALRDLHMVVSETGATVRHAPMPWVMADAVHLRQLFQNLVSNSLKYRRCDVPPQVDISAVRDGAHWVISVQDNGIGVAQEFHSRVFEPFKRLHGSDVTGAGIGLATCRRIVERYGGRIWLESTEGAGATFSFRLPAAEPK